MVVHLIGEWAMSRASSSSQPRANHLMESLNVQVVVCQYRPISMSLMPCWNVRTPSSYAAYATCLGQGSRVESQRHAAASPFTTGSALKSCTLKRSSSHRSRLPTFTRSTEGRIVVSPVNCDRCCPALSLIRHTTRTLARDPNQTESSERLHACVSE